MNPRQVNPEALGAWVFKCNPDVYDLPAEIVDGTSFVDNWSVADNYRSRLIAGGQKAILWMSGPRDGYAPRGIWGIGWTAGPRFKVRGIGGSYWVDDTRGALVEWMAPTAIHLLSEAHRLRADDVEAAPELADLEVFTAAQQSNPSWVSKGQLAALERLLPAWPGPDDVPTTIITLGPAGAGYGSAEDNAEVELAAMTAVMRYYEAEWGATVDDVHKQNLGWDLTVSTPTDEEWHVEVKGLTGTLPIVLLTANECRVAEVDTSWELAVVTCALGANPIVTIYDSEQVLRHATPHTVRADLRSEQGWSQ